ncbi:MAG: tandem-95 repeat protein, partial [Nanohaloarchaea archaeon]|nr:tandem-95 repeat protein [Candidatus Nanohaloarchaea archaeon]
MCDKYLSRFVYLSVLVLSMFFIIASAESPVVEAVPSLPYFMYGEITINDISAPTGTIVEAWSDDTLCGSTATTEKGFYGTPAWNRLIINCDADKTLTFRAKSPAMDSYATTAQTSTIQSGEIDIINLNFIWDGIIEPDNTAPVADNLYIDVDEDNSVAVTLTAQDADGDDPTYTLLTDPAHGILTGTAQYLTYMPNQDYNGDDSFTYKADDSIDDSNTATVYISIISINDIPIASDISAVTSQDTEKLIALVASDIDNNPLTYSIVSGPSHGAVSLASPIATYTPDANYYGGDTFIYKVNDGTADSNTATVTIDVTFVNQAPVISDFPDISLEPESIITTAWTLDSFVADETEDSSIIWTFTAPGDLSTTINPDRTLTVESSSDFSENTTLSLTASDGELSETGIMSIIFIQIIGDVGDSDWLSSPPMLPTLFYGAVHIDHLPAPVGTSIVAKIDDEVRGTFVTTVSGLYGDHPANRLIVNGASEDTGKTINFYIDGNLADETGTWQSGAVLELDLST